MDGGGFDALVLQVGFKGVGVALGLRDDDALALSRRSEEMCEQGRFVRLRDEVDFLVGAFGDAHGVVEDFVAGLFGWFWHGVSVLG